ncbi:MAG: ABC transporter ATP-binding protein [Spiroplasma sp.]|nr:ABC transporter ATP-binding protein [Mycoplasmatales bacterium]
MLKSYLLKYKILIVLSFMLVLLQVWATLYQPSLISDIIIALQEVDEFGNTTINHEAINKSGILMIIVGLIGLIAGVFNTFIAANISQKIGANIREDGFIKIQTFSFQDVDKFSTAHLIVRLTNDVTQVQNLLMMGFQMLIRVPFLFIGAFIMAIISFPQLWWTLIIFVVVVSVILKISMKLMIPKFEKIQIQNDHVNTVVKENMDGIRVIKSLVTEEKETEKYNLHVDELTKNLIGSGRIFSFMIPSFNLVANLITATAIFLVADWAIDDPELIGKLVSYTTYIMQIMFAIVMGGFIMMQASRAVVSLKRINEIFTTEPSIKYGEQELETIDTIEFNNVDFKYNSSKDLILKNISFKIKKGEKIGIIGRTGSGKSTLIQLLPRLFDSSSGNINVNGIDITQYTKHSLNSKIALTLQKPIIFSGSFNENILQGDNNATAEEVELASRQSQAFEFIDKKPYKFNGTILQKGMNLSGGQKQRLSISRSLVSKPELLILDDSTSALDAHSENLVKKALNEELSNLTTIIVAQKISSIVDMNKIIVMNDGMIDSIGSHAELLKTCDIYKEIFETQKDKRGDINEK